MKTIQAAGICAIRRGDMGYQVILVHRPRYDDWGLPKGKLDGNELAPVAATREFHEETGLRVRRLGAPLGVGRYHVGDRPKVVRWWLSEVDDQTPPTPLDPGEIDRAVWLPANEALERLNHADERLILRRALATPATVPLLVVRHAKAIDRVEWVGPDPLRTLSSKGHRQANALRRLLAAYGVRELVSSSSVRCLDTFAPYASQFGLQVIALSELSEENAEADPSTIPATMCRLRDQALLADGTMAICGHRPVLPAMAAALDLPYDQLKPSDTLVAHLGADGAPVAVEHHHLSG
ncbi:MAG: NUDIX domain-containing protein [Propionibacteriaceae bacterium]|jgi:8-oxo-dGTP diphosphatase|nr:NUDIX domain-containing protein [Propionibacteriaceae bacterium]